MWFIVARRFVLHVRTLLTSSIFFLLRGVVFYDDLHCCELVCYDWLCDHAEKDKDIGLNGHREVQSSY